LVACIEGRLVSQTDRWFEDLATAKEALEPLLQLHPDMQVQFDEWHGLADGSLEQAPAFLQDASQPTRFVRLSGRHITPLLGFGLLGLIGVTVLAMGWRAQPSQPTPVADRAANAKTVTTPMVHANRDLVDILQSWQRLPIDPAGWLLQTIDCQVRDSGMACRAQYRRRQTEAHNEGLKQHQPEGWSMTADSLEQASLIRNYPLNRATWRPNAALGWHDGVTVLQRFSDQVAHLSVSDQPQLATFVPERTVEGWTLMIRLPLREVARLDALRLPVRWRQVNLHMVQGAAIDARHGHLMLELTGDWYARR
jgi:hypothetical protein